MKSLVNYIERSSKLSSLDEYILEAQIYNGGEDLAKYISKLIKDKPKENFFVINSKDLDFKNIFFRYLLIYINEGINEELIDAKYHDKKDNSKISSVLDNTFKWNNEEKIFNYIELSLWTTSEEDREIDYSDLTHELRHAWDDYQERLKNPNKNIFASIDIEKYNISRNLYNATNRFEVIIGYINYVTDKFEINAFSTQAMSKLKANLDKYSNFDEALKWQFENNKIFKRYALIRNWFLECKESKSLSNSLCNTYRKYYNSKLSNEEIIKELDNKFKEYYYALVEDIDIILDEYGKGNAL